MLHFLHFIVFVLYYNNVKITCLFMINEVGNALYTVDDENIVHQVWKCLTNFNHTKFSKNDFYLFLCQCSVDSMLHLSFLYKNQWFYEFSNELSCDFIKNCNLYKTFPFVSQQNSNLNRISFHCWSSLISCKYFFLFGSIQSRKKFPFLFIYRMNAHKSAPHTRTMQDYFSCSAKWKIDL